MMRLILLLVYLSLAFMGSSQDEIALSDGQLFINRKKIGLTTNKAELDMAMDSKGKHALLIKTYDPNTRLTDDTKHHTFTYKDQAVKFELSAPGYKMEEVVIRLHMEPLYDLPKRLQKRTYPVYQGSVKIGNVLLSQHITTDSVDSLFNAADIITKSVTLTNNYSVPYVLIKHNDWLIKLVFSIASNKIKYIVLQR